MYSTTARELFFFFNDTATTEIYTLSLHDALPICGPESRGDRGPPGRAHSRGSSPSPRRTPARGLLPALRAAHVRAARPAGLAGRPPAPRAVGRRGAPAGAARAAG